MCAIAERKCKHRFAQIYTNSNRILCKLFDNLRLTNHSMVKMKNRTVASHRISASFNGNWCKNNLQYMTYIQFIPPFRRFCIDAFHWDCKEWREWNVCDGMYIGLASVSFPHLKSHFYFLFIQFYQDKKKKKLNLNPYIHTKQNYEESKDINEFKKKKRKNRKQKFCSKTINSNMSECWSLCICVSVLCVADVLAFDHRWEYDFLYFISFARNLIKCNAMDCVCIRCSEIQLKLLNLTISNDMAD